MVSFQRMRDELDDLGTSVTNKLPPIGRNACIAVLAGVLVAAFLLGFAVSYGAQSGGGGGGAGGGSRPEASARVLAAPNYVFVSNNSLSCPPLKWVMRC